MKQYIIIEKDRQKWLRPTLDPSDIDQPSKLFQNQNNLPYLLYLGSRSVGEVVDESEVMQVHQWRNKNSSSLTWWGITDGNDVFRKGINAAEYIEIRTAYVDVKVAIDESHKSDYWKRRCLAAEKYIAKSPCDPDIYEEQMIAYHEWQSIVNKEPK